MVKSTLLIVFFLCFNFQYLVADERKKILEKLKTINSIKFSFIQKTNQTIEDGKCILLFPKKLNCKYFDDKLKELIINESRMVVTQKRYNKSYFYSMSKSPFLNILDKKKLAEIINGGKIEIKDGKIELINRDKLDQKITIMFEKKNYNLLGWKIDDQYNNRVSFIIKIEAINERVKLNNFIIPYAN